MLVADSSAMLTCKVAIYQIAMFTSIAWGLFAFTLPDTPPKATGKATVSQILGTDAFVLFKDRSFSIFFISSYVRNNLVMMTSSLLLYVLYGIYASNTSKGENNQILTNFYQIFVWFANFINGHVRRDKYFLHLNLEFSTMLCNTSA